MAITFKGSDVEQFKKDLHKQGFNLTADVKKAINEVALLVESSAKEAIKSGGHIVTNRLRSSVHAELRPSGAGADYAYKDSKGNTSPGKLSQNPKRTKDEYEVWVGTNVDYAWKINRLTPFLDIAFEQNRSIFIQEIKKAVNKPQG